MAIVAPEKLDAFLAVDRQVGCRDQRPRRGHRRRAPADLLARRADRRRRPVHRRRRRSGLRAPRRLPHLDRRAARRLGVGAPARCRPRHAAPAVPAARREPQPRRHLVGDQPVRLLRDGQHRPVVPRRRRHDPRRRALRARLRDRDRLQRPLLPARPLRGRQARPRRGVPQRRRHRRGARPPSPTASTSAAPRTPRSCGSSRRPSTACRTDASNSASRSPAATCRSTTRPATSRSSRPRSWECSASSTTSRAASRRAGRMPARTSTCSASPSTELSGSAWAGTIHGHLGGRPPAVDLGAREAARRAAARGIAAVARLERARPVLRRPRAGARRSGHALRRRRAGVAHRAHGARRGGCRIRPVLGVHRPRHRDGAARGRREVPRALRGTGLPRAADRRDRLRRRRRPARRSRCRGSSPCRSRSCATCRPRRCPPRSAPTVDRAAPS